MPKIQTSVSEKTNDFFVNLGKAKGTKASREASNVLNNYAFNEQEQLRGKQ